MAEPVLCLLSTCAVPGRQHRDGCDGEQCTCLRAQAAPGLYLCQRDTDRIGSDAQDLAQLHGELALRLLADTGTGERVAGTPDDTRIPNAAAVEVRTEIRHVLAAWCRLVAEERGFALPADEVSAMGAYVARSAEWLAATEYADEVAGELAALRSRAWGVAYPSGTRVIDIAPCPMPDCAGTVRAVLRRTDALLPSELACDADDEHRWPAGTWHSLRRRLIAMEPPAPAVVTAERRGPAEQRLRLGEPCLQCGRPITGATADPILEDWSKGYREVMAVVYELQPCGHRFGKAVA